MKRLLDNEKPELSKQSSHKKFTGEFSGHPASENNDLDTFNEETELWITIIDVGQGESTLIQYRKIKEEKWTDAFVVLIDGGRAHFAEHSIVPTLKKLGVEKIDIGICTHYDADHMEGLAALPLKYRPHKMYERSLTVRLSDDKVRNFREKYADRERLKTGDIIKLDVDDAPTLECLSVSTGTVWKDENDYSIALVLKYGKFAFYLGGDLTSDTEDGLNLGHVCAFKCGHHGSKHSTSEAFLQKITPSAAFISASSHSYCHPDDETIKRLCEETSVEKIYLTNCVYNRAGINGNDFEEQEQRLKDYIFDKIIQIIGENEELIHQTPSGFEKLLRLNEATSEEAEKLAFDTLLNEDKLVLKSGEIRKRFPGEVNTLKRKFWNDLASLYYAAYDLHQNLDDRKTRVTKGIVAATETHLGNFHIIVSGTDAAEHHCKFNVYYREGNAMSMFCHDPENEVEFEEEIDRDDLKAVKRDEGYNFLNWFSMITGPSGEERQNLTPDEVAELADRIDDLINLIYDLEKDDLKAFNDFINDRTPKVNNNVKYLKIREEYKKLLEFYHSVSEEWGGEYALKDPTELAKDHAEEAKKYL